MILASLTGNHNCRWCPPSYTSNHEPWWLHYEEAWKREPHWPESWFSRPGILLHYVILEIYSLSPKLLQWNWVNIPSKTCLQVFLVCYHFFLFHVLCETLVLWLTLLCFELVQLVMKSIDWHDWHSSFLWMMIWTCGTKAVLNWMEDIHFTASATLHGVMFSSLWEFGQVL